LLYFMNHLLSLLSALWVVINLLIGVTALIPVSIISWLIPNPAVSRACFFIVDHIYRTAVKVDSFWMQQVVGIELVIKGEVNTHKNPVVICNHQSWFDIPLVQEVITGNGPIIKFLIKRELVWVPIVGWICLALNFPRLHRGQNTSTGESDFSLIQKASKNHGNESGALLVFPEGTRFTEPKKITQHAPYQHLLKPKSGGLKMIQKHAAPDTPLIDITINYHQKNVRIWNCLHGDPKKITITLEHYQLTDIDDIEGWLNERWVKKDELLSNN
jgi:1-acyl-sn-glycerol-3-phosphate acyltransferase